jgi:hypothetical protein
MNHSQAIDTVDAGAMPGTKVNMQSRFQGRVIALVVAAIMEIDRWRRGQATFRLKIKSDPESPDCKSADPPDSGVYNILIYMFCSHLNLIVN